MHGFPSLTANLQIVMSRGHMRLCYSIDTHSYTTVYNVGHFEAPDSQLKQ